MLAGVAAFFVSIFAQYMLVSGYQWRRMDDVLDKMVLGVLVHADRGRRMKITQWTNTRSGECLCWVRFQSLSCCWSLGNMWSRHIGFSPYTASWTTSWWARAFSDDDGSPWSYR